MLTAALLTYRRGDDPASAEVLDSCPEPSVARAAGAGVVVGSMTGFFGVGGGFLIVPGPDLAPRPGHAASDRYLACDHHLDRCRGLDQPPGPWRGSRLAVDHRARRLGGCRSVGGQRAGPPRTGGDFGPGFRRGGGRRGGLLARRRPGARRATGWMSGGRSPRPRQGGSRPSAFGPPAIDVRDHDDRSVSCSRGASADDVAGQGLRTTISPGACSSSQATSSALKPSFPFVAAAVTILS